MAKYPLILMSGGVDSTLLAQQACENHGGFYGIYVTGTQGTQKIEAERLALGRIGDLLRARYPEARIVTNWYLPEGAEWLTEATYAARGFAQARSWFFAAMSYVDPDRHSEVQIGYNATDQISHLVYALEQGWSYLFPVFKVGDMVPLRFPLIAQTLRKKTVLKKLHPELYKETWVCELPKMVDNELYECGFCDACAERKLYTYASKEGIYDVRLGETRAGVYQPSKSEADDTPVVEELLDEIVEIPA